MLIPIDPNSIPEFFNTDCFSLYCGESSSLLQLFKENSIDSAVFDPPDGINQWVEEEWNTFTTKVSQDKSPSMEASNSEYFAKRGLPIAEQAKARDPFIAFLKPIFDQIYRVLKPGSFSFSWALPRSCSWTCRALEDSGFIVRDVFDHHFVQGCPKGKNSINPSHENYILFQKPTKLSIEENVKKYGVGKLNIDDCRIGNRIVGWNGAEGMKKTLNAGKYGGLKSGNARPVEGCWPKNTLFSHHVACVEDEYCTTNCPVYLSSCQKGEDISKYFTTFYFKAKPSSKEKNEGIEGENTHQTVKSIELFRWLIKLVSSKDQIILDPFMGSGTTGVAALYEERQFLGIEKSPKYFDLAKQRMVHHGDKLH